MWLRRVSALAALSIGMLLILAGLAMTVSAEQTALPQPAGLALSGLSEPAPATAGRPTQPSAPAKDTAPTTASVFGQPPARAPRPAETAPEIPRRLLIPAINLDAPVQPVRLIVSRDGRTAEWGVPSGRAAGWHNTSTRLGETGNLVLNGHHNIQGSVFARVKDLQPSDQIIVIGERRRVTYEVVERKLLLERGQPLATRIENARWIMPTEDARLTLVTCWPPTDNSHRLIVIARPVAEEWLTADPATGPR